MLWCCWVLHPHPSRIQLPQSRELQQLPCCINSCHCLVLDEWGRSHLSVLFETLQSQEGCVYLTLNIISSKHGLEDTLKNAEAFQPRTAAIRGPKYQMLLLWITKEMLPCLWACVNWESWLKAAFDLLEFPAACILACLIEDARVLCFSLSLRDMAYRQNDHIGL